MQNNTIYLPETAGSLMVTAIPVVLLTEKMDNVMDTLAREDWKHCNEIYVISEKQTLVGQVSISKVLSAEKTEVISNLMSKPKITVNPTYTQERVVIEAIKAGVTSVPVVDKAGKLLGAILPDKIIEVLHMEHLEDFLRSSGIRGKGSHILKLATSNLYHMLKARLPWLLIGLAVGAGLGIVTSQFEWVLQKNIALAFFIPVIAYVADSVGTQTETIFIRALTVLKINVYAYLLKELVVGMLIGACLGLLGGLAAWFISRLSVMGVIVGLSLFLTVTVATFLACLVPIIFKSLGRDPALGSGPLATAIQDIISISIYFVVAKIILLR